MAVEAVAQRAVESATSQGANSQSFAATPNPTEDLPDETQLSMKKMMIKQWVEDEIIYQSALNEGAGWEESDLFLIENYKKSI